MNLLRYCAITFTVLGSCATFAGCSQTSPTRSKETVAAPNKRLASNQAAEIQVAFGRSLESEGNFEKAMIAYREAVRQSPKRPEAHVRLAILLDRLGRFAEASEHYESALKADPGNPEIYCDRGYSLCLQGREKEAETALRQAIALKPNLARAHNNLGVLLGRAGRTDEALAEFRKAGSPEADAHLNLAFALGQTRRWSEAQAHVAIARKLGQDRGQVNADAARLEMLFAKAASTRPAAPDLNSDPAVLTTGGIVTGDRRRK